MLLNALTNVVKLSIDVFCSSTCDGVIGKINRTFVVAIKSDGEVKWKCNFIEEGVVPSSLSGGLGEGDVLSFCGGEGDDMLFARRPGYGGVCKEESVCPN